MIQYYCGSAAYNFSRAVALQGDIRYKTLQKHYGCSCHKTMYKRRPQVLHWHYRKLRKHKGNHQIKRLQLSKFTLSHNSHRNEQDTVQIDSSNSYYNHFYFHLKIIIIFIVSTAEYFMPKLKRPNFGRFTFSAIIQLCLLHFSISQKSFFLLQSEARWSP